MKITDVTVTLFAWDNIPATTYGRHTGRIASKSDVGLVTIQTDQGIEGHAFLGGAGRGASNDAGTLINFLKPILMDQDPLDREKLYHATWQRGRNTTMRCLGAVDVALWDLYGKALKQPVYQLLGGAERASHQVWRAGDGREVVPYCTIISDQWDRDSVLREQVERVVKLRELGYRAFKVEPMYQDPGTIVELARLTRQAVGPGVILCVDVGYLWNDVGTALATIERLVEHDIPPSRWTPWRRTPSWQRGPPSLWPPASTR